MREVESKADAEPASLKEEGKPEDSVRVTSGKTAQVLVSEEVSLSINDFHNNDNKVLELLNEAGSKYSFKGLMRKLNLHQQSLSRALRRLEELGLVEKTAEGYRLGRLADSIGLRPRTPKGTDYMQLLQTYIPVNVKPGEVVRRLVGKWFKNLRWLGMIESGTGYTLQWASDDGSFQINLRLISDYIVIETNASTEKEKVQAMAGSYAIYQQITRVLQNRVENNYLLDYRNGALNVNN
ncbi:MAG: MarR family transcriptional regulator [Nitrososphaera sp.]|nr:MarR family transcriptional regulator [Nitrososphaera sp.]